ncbi:hypothetical protein ANCCAN_27419, partial [Ancylostoma caninum]
MHLEIQRGSLCLHNSHTDPPTEQQMLMTSIIDLALLLPCDLQITSTMRGIVEVDAMTASDGPGMKITTTTTHLDHPEEMTTSVGLRMKASIAVTMDPNQPPVTMTVIDQRSVNLTQLSMKDVIVMVMTILSTVKGQTFFAEMESGTMVDIDPKIWSIHHTAVTL